MSDQEGQDPKNVHSFAEEKKKRAKRQGAESGGSAEKRATKAAALNEYSRALSGLPALWPDFPRKFRIVADDAGVRSFVEIDGRDVVTHLPSTTVRDALLKYNRGAVQAAFPESPTISSKEATEVATCWAACQEPIEEHAIAGVRELSEPGLCWQRLEFDLAEGPTPTFDELFGRMDTNALAVKAWIGSLFDPKSSRQQYVWLHGAGRNGKSSLIGFLKRVLTATYKAAYVSPRRPVSPFWTRSLLGKRVVAFSDFSYFDFVTDDLFKSLTGGDAVETEIKCGATQTSDLICKIIFASNEKPNITGSDADMRRAIYCEIAPFVGEALSKEAYEEQLWKEAAAFLWKCREAYAPYKTTAGIDVDKDHLAALVEANEEKWYNTVAAYFEVETEARTAPHDLQAACRVAGLNDKEMGKFKLFLERKFNVRKVMQPDMRTSCGRSKSYKGIKVTEETLRRINAAQESRF